jgi:hypothetical protein
MDNQTIPNSMQDCSPHGSKHTKGQWRLYSTILTYKALTYTPSVYAPSHSGVACLGSYDRPLNYTLHRTYNIVSQIQGVQNVAKVQKVVIFRFKKQYHRANSVLCFGKSWAVYGDGSNRPSSRHLSTMGHHKISLDSVSRKQLARTVIDRDCSMQH